MAFCRKCGFELQKTDGFCANCGAKIDMEYSPPGQPNFEGRRRRSARKIKGYCDTCMQAWYEDDLKCPSCGGDDYTMNSEYAPSPYESETAKKPISNTIVWIIAVLPIIGLIIENAVALASNRSLNDMWWITLVLNTALCWWDERRVRKQRHDFNLSSVVFLVPVYLFQRAKRLKHNFSYFIVWLVTFAIIILVPTQYILNNPFINSFGLGSVQTINTVKEGTFLSYPSTKIGPTFDNLMSNEKWTSFTTDGGFTAVQVEGDAFLPGHGQSRLLIQFLMDKGSPEFSISYVSVNGRPLDTLEISVFLQTVFSLEH